MTTSLPQILENIINKLLQEHDFSNNLELTKQTIGKFHINPNYPIILIGGTNGKGSTCAYLTKILELSGYKVGTYTSPHVFNYNERISINNTPIDNIKLTELLTPLIEYSNYSLGLFKTFTLAAHQYFIQQNIDVAVIEVGIGGTNDVTNLFEPTISAITSIDYDHCHILGNTLEEIGLQKAGIFRENKWAIFGGLNIPQSVVSYAHKINAKLEYLNNDFSVVKNDTSFNVLSKDNNFYTLPYPALRGKEQVYNVATALTILTKLRQKFPVTIGTIKTALLQTTLVGRFQVIPGVPQIIFDVAHNPQAVQHMLENMVKLPFAKNNIAVFGIASDKDVNKVIDLCKKSFNVWHIAKLNSSRGLDSHKIKDVLVAHGVDLQHINEHTSINDAMTSAVESVTDADRIICFGSFLAVEDAIKKYYLKAI